METSVALSPKLQGAWGAALLAVAVDDAYNVIEDGTLPVAAPGVLGNDSGDASLAMRLVAGPSNGTLSLSPIGLTNITNPSPGIPRCCGPP